MKSKNDIFNEKGKQNIDNSLKKLKESVNINLELVLNGQYSWEEAAEDVAEDAKDIALTAGVRFFKDNRKNIVALIVAKIELFAGLFFDGIRKNILLAKKEDYANIVYYCLLIQSLRLEEKNEHEKSYKEIRAAVTDYLEKTIKLTDADLQKKLIANLSDIAMSIINISLGGNDERKLEELVADTGKLLAKRAVENVIAAMANKLPDYDNKNEVMDELSELAKDSIENINNQEELASLLKQKGIKKACQIADRQIDKAIEALKKELPETELTDDACKLLHEVTKESLKELQQADSLEDAEKILVRIAEDKARTEAGKQLKKGSKEVLNKAGGALFDAFKHKGRSSGKYNKKLKDNINSGTEAMQKNVADNIDAVLAGNKNWNEAAVDVAKGTAKDLVKEKVEEKAGVVIQRGTKQLAKSLHVTGKGSRKINRHIDGMADGVATGLTNSFVSKVTDVINGDKDVGEAAKDVVVDTGKAAALDYMEKHGDQVVREAVAKLTVLAEKKIANEVVKKTAVTALSKLGSANAVINVAATVYDIGVSIKKLATGEISQEQFFREIGEKGTSALVSSTFAMAGTMIAGPLGAAVGSMVGYLATNMLYGSVMQAFADARMAKENYYKIKATCEEAKLLMRQRRAQFEKETRELFDYRKEVFRKSFDAVEMSMQTNDMDAFSKGLNDIAAAFGKELQFASFDEFDAFMMDENSVFKL